MITKRFCVILLVAIIGVGLAGVLLLKKDSARLRERVADLRRRSEQVVRTREDNKSARQVLARAQADVGDGARAIHADLLRVRAELQELEQRAGKTHEQLQAQAAVDAVNLESNRDPEKGLVRLENFKNLGSATPSAAFQTFVWAALAGDDAQLAGLITFDAEAHEAAQAAIASLAEADRAKYSTPEKLAAVFFAAALTAQPSAQIVDIALPDPQHAALKVRGLTDKTQQVPMRWSAAGWQIVVPVGLAEKLGRWVTSRPVSAKNP